MQKHRFLLTVGALLTIGSLSACSHTNPQKIQTSFDQGKFDFSNQNYSAAYKELLPAAKYGNADAQYAIGYMAFYGYGTGENVEEAQYWMSKAAAQNQADALQALPVVQAAFAQHTAMFSPPAKFLQSPPPSQTTVNNLAAVTSHTADEQQLLAANASDYTWQLMADTKASRVQSFALQLPVSERALIIRKVQNGQTWYVLIYGFYPTTQTAQQGLTTIPNQLVNQLKPWLRKVSVVQTELK